ncbi:rhomboid family intramembrane serine protease [Candidatus Sumerlaeota bacterium]|nr:rhomboid family intramembrane serine protease [Candidatus Sumerlaeota bacterium]
MKAMFRDAHQSFSSAMPPMTRFLFYATAIGFIATNLLVILTQRNPALAAIVDRIIHLSPVQAIYQGNVWQLLTYPLNNGGLGMIPIIGLLFTLLIIYQIGSLIESRMSSRRFGWFAVIVVLATGLFYAAYNLLLGQSVPYLGSSPIIAALLTAALIWFPRMEINFWGIPMQLRMLIFVFAILLGLDTLRGVTTQGLLRGIIYTLPSYLAIATAYVLIRFRGVLDWFEGFGGGGRRRSAKVVRMNMGHPGRHTDADDLYDDPHWKLDQ